MYFLLYFYIVLWCNYIAFVLHILNFLVRHILELYSGVFCGVNVFYLRCISILFVHRVVFVLYAFCIPRGDTFGNYMAAAVQEMEI